MYYGHARLCVCLSAAVCLHYCMDPDVTWRSGKQCPLVVLYWADLQSVHGLRCYGNITRTRNFSEYMPVLAVCLDSHSDWDEPGGWRGDWQASACCCVCGADVERLCAQLSCDEMCEVAVTQTNLAVPYCVCTVGFVRVKVGNAQSCSCQSSRCSLTARTFTDYR